MPTPLIAVPAMHSVLSEVRLEREARPTSDTLVHRLRLRVVRVGQRATTARARSFRAHTSNCSGKSVQAQLEQGCRGAGMQVH